MRLIDEFRQPDLVRALAKEIGRLNAPPVTLMEVCGTHTMSIARHGIRKMLPPQIRLISGPGCPVCVTPQGEIDAFLSLAGYSEMILSSFGDMLRVPGSSSSLEELRAKGADVRIVYSPLDAVETAKQNPQKQVVFFGVGFETTTPTVAVAIRAAAESGLSNFSVFSVHKMIPPALTALLSAPECAINGLICPGHVSTIIGANAYKFVADEYKVPAVIAGFEPVDILQSVLMLVQQIVQKRAEVEIQYARTVTWEGNKAAQELVDSMFEPKDSDWRGLGSIPLSGLGLNKEMADFDAAKRFPELAQIPFIPEPAGCRCGEILKGVTVPEECPLFSNVCTPAKPIGPCMVSGEGACAAAYKYGGLDV